MQWPISWSDVKDHIDDIEDGIDPKLLPEGGFGWSEGSFELIFDGNISGKETVAGGQFVKISDTPVDLSEVTAIEAIGPGQRIIFGKSELATDTHDGFQILGRDNDGSVIPLVVTVSAEGDVFGEDKIASTGVYVFYNDDTTPATYVSHIYSSGTIYPIDPKYLPEGGVGYDSANYIVRETDIKGNSTAYEVYGYYQAQCDTGWFGPVIDMTVGKKYTVEFDAVSYEIEVRSVGSYYCLGNASLYNKGNTNSGEPFCFVLTGSSYKFVVADDDNHTVTIQGEPTIHKIDSKYIPALDSITLNGADGKQYSITVDASGALVVTVIE